MPPTPRPSKKQSEPAGPSITGQNVKSENKVAKASVAPTPASPPAAKPSQPPPPPAAASATPAVPKSTMKEKPKLSEPLKLEIEPELEQEPMTPSLNSLNPSFPSIKSDKSNVTAYSYKERESRDSYRHSHHKNSSAAAAKSERKSKGKGHDESEASNQESEGEGEEKYGYGGYEYAGEGEIEYERGPAGAKHHHPHHFHHFQEESEVSSDESLTSEQSVRSDANKSTDKSSEESLDREERRYLIDKHSFLHLKDPSLEYALIPEEKPPEKEYKGRKAERHRYKKICEELGVQPLKAFLEHLRGEVMDLRNYGLGANDIEVICKIMADNKYIDTLLLSGNFAGKAGGEAIAQMIETNTRITHLDIGSMLIQPVMKKICDAIKINTVLESIDMSMNELTDSEMPYIAEFLYENITVRELYLQRNKITDAGLWQLSKGFVKNKKKKVKKQRSPNTDADAGVVAEEDDGAPNETIALLDLGWNRIKGGQQAGSFFEVMAKHRNIKFFNVAGNCLNNAKGVIQVLGKNKNLEVMSIAYNRIEGKACPAIGKALAFTPSPLKHFVAGPNLWRQKATSQMFLPLTAPKSVETLETLDMSMGMCVGRKFLKTKRKVWKVKPELQILHAGNPYSVAKIHPVDGQVVTIKRGHTVCENFATPLKMLIDKLRTEPGTMTQDEFKKFVKSCDLYKDRVLTETFFKYFPKGTSQQVDCAAIISVYDKVFPKAGAAKSKKSSAEEEEDEDEF